MTTAHCRYAYDLVLDTGHRCAPHGHHATELVYCFGTTGELHQGGGMQVYGDGDCFVYQPGGEHWIRTTAPGTQVCVCVTGCGAERLPAGVHAGNTALRDAALAVRRVLQDGGPLQRERLDLAAGGLVLALRMQLDAPGTDAPPPALAARRLIDEGFAGDLTITDLARSVFVSPDYLRQLFRKEFGQSPTHYLISRRIDHARDLLEHGDLPIKKVAAACGIDNPYYFARLFRKVTGTTPSAWRKRFR